MLEKTTNNISSDSYSNSKKVYKSSSLNIPEDFDYVEALRAKDSIISNSNDISIIFWSPKF